MKGQMADSITIKVGQGILSIPRNIQKTDYSVYSDLYVIEKEKKKDSEIGKCPGSRSRS